MIGASPYAFRRKRFCSVRCANLWMNRRRWELHNHAAELLPRFEAKFMPEPNSGCFLWFGATVPDGYGSFGITTKHTMKAHRLAWQLYCGPIPVNAHVLHRCDNRACVNPDHLFLGDNDTNVADRVAKGRTAGKLTQADDLEILNDTQTRRTIALKYNVSMATISRAKQRAKKCLVLNR